MTTSIVLSYLLAVTFSMKCWKSLVQDFAFIVFSSSTPFQCKPVLKKPHKCCHICLLLIFAHLYLYFCLNLCLYLYLCLCFILVCICALCLCLCLCLRLYLRSHTNATSSVYPYDPYDIYSAVGSQWIRCIHVPLGHLETRNICNFTVFYLICKVVKMYL